jgi:hypothetical protein
MRRWQRIADPDIVEGIIESSPKAGRYQGANDLKEKQE